MNKNVLRKGLRMAGKPLMDRMLKPTHTRVCRFAAYYENINVDENAVLYESRDGNSVTGNPYAIFRYLLHQPGYDHLMHYWSVNDPDRLPEAIAEYGRHPNVKFVKRHTKRYLKCLAGCRYLINNSTFPSYFIPKKEQIYMNTWHGTPLKQMGFDIPGNPALSQNVVRNFLSADYLLSPNRHTTKMYTDSYKLNGLYEGEIIEEGYPRIDLTLNADRGQVLHSLMMNGVTLEKRKPTILYAPTWKRDDRFGVKADLRRLMADVNHLQKEIGDAYNLLLKVHPFMYKEAVTREAFADKLVPDCVDANELLAAVDVLITDYSSIFFDFLTTGRPVLFYVPDIEEYLEERGHTIDYAQWPGPLLFHSEQLVKAVRNLTDVKDEYEDRYAAMRNEYCRNEDGNVCARIVDYVFTGNHRPLHTVSCRKKRKEKILIYAGGMRDNGITSSFINLMDNIDHNRYDVSCFTATPHQEEVIKNIHRVNRNARWLFKPGLPLYRLGEQYQDKWIHFRGVDGRLEKKLYPHKAYEREHQRLFGNSQFDYVIDFSGYSLYWAKHLVAAKTGGKLCFMHNDLLSDSERTVNGKKPHKINLHGLFSIYDRFDKLISVSKGTMELNRDKLSRYADKAKFTYVMNSINPETILNLANDEDKPADIPDQKFAGWTTEPFRARGELVSGAFGGVRCSLLDHPNAAAVETHDRLRGEELEITRAAHHDGKRYYKVHRNGRHAGWLEADAVTLLPNRVISERKVDKIAKVRKGWPIYTLPIGVKGAEFIADSDEFHNRIVVISKEADTFEGEFARFAVDGKTIGWTACSGLQVYPSCTLDDALSRKERWKRKGKRKWLLTNNKRKRRISNKKAEQQTTEEVGEERDIQAPKSSDINFVNMGRLSPEKGQDMLIRAFADVHRVHENSCLYILGKGPLENDLASLAAELGLDGCVHLAGQLDNPFGLMKKCDAFVLSSHYEGQPMVLLEALTLGMNIVATDIVANRTVLENGKYGMLVEKSVEGLKEGMFSVINHKGMPAYQPFDSRRYNEQAMQTFYDCLKR